MLYVHLHFQNVLLQDIKLASMRFECVSLHSHIRKGFLYLCNYYKVYFSLPYPRGVNQIANNVQFVKYETTLGVLVSEYIKEDHNIYNP